MSLKPLRIAVVMDPIDEIKYEKDTSLAILLAAKQRGWPLYYAEMADLRLRDGVAEASAYQADTQSASAPCARGASRFSLETDPWRRLLGNLCTGRSLADGGIRVALGSARSKVNQALP